jgi:hypothetical protein
MRRQGYKAFKNNQGKEVEEYEESINGWSGVTGQRSIRDRRVCSGTGKAG